MRALDAALRPLRHLQVLVMSQCNVALPEAVRRMHKLERLVRGGGWGRERNPWTIKGVASCGSCGAQPQRLVTRGGGCQSPASTEPDTIAWLLQEG